MDIARLNARSKLSNQQRDFTDNELGRQSHIRNVHLRYHILLYDFNLNKYIQTKCIIASTHVTSAAKIVATQTEQSHHVEFTLSAKVVIEIASSGRIYSISFSSLSCSSSPSSLFLSSSLSSLSSLSCLFYLSCVSSYRLFISVKNKCIIE